MFSSRMTLSDMRRVEEWWVWEHCHWNTAVRLQDLQWSWWMGAGLSQQSTTCLATDWYERSSEHPSFFSWKALGGLVITSKMVGRQGEAELGLRSSRGAGMVHWSTGTQPSSGCQIVAAKGFFTNPKLVKHVVLTGSHRDKGCDASITKPFSRQEYIFGNSYKA